MSILNRAPNSATPKPLYIATSLPKPVVQQPIAKPPTSPPPWIDFSTYWR